MAKKFSDFTNEAVDTDLTNIVGFKSSTNTRYSVAQLAAGVLAADSGFTQGSVIFTGASGVLSQDNANFFWDDATNRLGINTATPSTKLHVIDAGYPQQTWGYDATSYATLTVADDSHTTLATGEEMGDIILDASGDVTINAGSGNIKFQTGVTDLANITTLRTESFIIACSDEATALAAGSKKAIFRMPYAFTLTAVRASLTTAGTASGLTTIDINEAFTTILSTKITIDLNEKTSVTAFTQPVISDATLAYDAQISIDIDAISGGATETGLKVTLIGYQTV